MTTINSSKMILGLACIISLPAYAGLRIQDNGKLTDSQGNSMKIEVAEAPLQLQSFLIFDSSTGSLAEPLVTQAVPSTFNASLSGQTTLELPRAGGTTKVTLTTQGLSLTAKPITVPDGITFSLSGGELQITSTANSGPDTRVGVIAVRGTGIGAVAGRAAATLQIGFSQRVCHPLPCLSDQSVSFVAPSAMAKPAQLTTPDSNSRFDWAAVSEALTERASAGANTVRIMLDDDRDSLRVSGSALSNLVHLCAAKRLICVLDRSMIDAGAATDYWVSPDVHSALYGAESHIILALRGNGGETAAITKLRASGLGHMLLLDASAQVGDKAAMRPNAAALLRGDPHHNLLFAALTQEVAVTAMQSGLPVVVGPLAVLVRSTIVVDGPPGFRLASGVAIIDVDENGGTASVALMPQGLTKFTVFGRGDGIETALTPSGNLLTVFIDPLKSRAILSSESRINVLGQSSDGRVNLDVIIEVRQIRR